MCWKLRFHAVSRSSCVEHRDAVGHVVEGDPQLGLTLADLVQQPRVFHRDNRLRREVLQQRDLLVGERPDFLAVCCDSSEQPIVLAQRHGENVRMPPSWT